MQQLRQPLPRRRAWFGALALVWLLIAAWTAYANVALVSFTATSVPNGVRVEWRTETEVGTAGFYLLRTQDPNTFLFMNLDANGNGRLELGEVTPLAITDLIESEGSPSSGSTYTVLDTNVVNGQTYYYMLAELEQNNDLTLPGNADDGDGGLNYISITAGAQPTPTPLPGGGIGGNPPTATPAPQPTTPAGATPPAQPTAPPAGANPTAPAPGQPTTAPDQPTAAPGQPTAAPGQPTAAPGQPTQAPGQTAAQPQATAVPGQTVAPEATAVAPQATTAAPEAPVAATEAPLVAAPETTVGAVPTADPAAAARPADNAPPVVAQPQPGAGEQPGVVAGSGNAVGGEGPQGSAETTSAPIGGVPVAQAADVTPYPGGDAAFGQPGETGYTGGDGSGATGSSPAPIGGGTGGSPIGSNQSGALPLPPGAAQESAGRSVNPLIWIGFIGGLLVFGAGVIGAILLFSRRRAP